MCTGNNVSIESKKEPNMAQKDEVKFQNLVIKVTNPDINLSAVTKFNCDRYKRWTILLKMDGKTVSEYYKACRDAGLKCAANNPRDASSKEVMAKKGSSPFIELNAPKQETTKKVTATKKVNENVVALH